MNANEQIAEQFTTCIRLLEETLKVRPLQTRDDLIFIGYATGLAFALDKLGIEHQELPERAKRKVYANNHTGEEPF